MENFPSDNKENVSNGNVSNGNVSGRSNNRLRGMTIRNKEIQSVRRKNNMKGVSGKIKYIARMFSPDREKNASTTAVNEISRNYQHEERVELYIAPTNLHKACFSASCFEDFRSQITSSYSSNADITFDMKKKDCNGRNPFHLLALNKTLVSSMAKEEDYQDGYANLDVSKIATFSDFIIKALLPICPSILLDEDDNGFLPFEEIILQWIDDAHGDDHQQCSLKLNLPDTDLRIENVQTKLRDKTLTAVKESGSDSSDLECSSSNTYGTENLLISSSSSSPSRCKSKDLPSLHSAATRPEENIHKDLESMQGLKLCYSRLHQFFPVNVQTTIHVKYALYLLSDIIDCLDKEATREDGESIQTQSKRSLFSASRESSAKSLEGCFLVGKICSPLEHSEDSCEKIFERSDSVFHNIRSNLLAKFASTPHIIKTLLLISNIDEKDIIFQYSAVRKIMITKESIGKWLPSMLQCPRRKVTYYAVEYLELLSDVLKEEESRIRHSINGTETDKKTKELYDEFRYLDGLIPSMLALDHNMIEKAATTPIISKVLDRIITAPFGACLIFFDVVLLAMLIFTFQRSIRGFLLGEKPVYVIRWIYTANSFAFYFVIKELGKGVALHNITTSRLFWTNLLLNGWSMVDILSIIMAITSSVTMRFTLVDFDLTDSQRMRILLAVTTALLWIKFLAMMKTINRQLATFTLAIFEITRDIIWYIIILVIFVLSFAQMFYTLIVPDSCYKKPLEDECDPDEYYLKVYTILLGDFGLFEREDFDNRVSLSLFIFFSMVVVILLMNVLIAIISDSYEKCMVKSKGLFGRTRVLLVAEIISFQGLFANVEEGDTGGLAKKIGWKRTRGGFTFICLATVVVLIWIVAETILYRSGEGDYGTFHLSLISIFINVTVLFILLIVLCKRHWDKNQKQVELYAPIQNIMLRLLGTSGDPRIHGSEEVDEWEGRVVFLQKEILRASAKASKRTYAVMESELANSNRRMMRRIQSLEHELKVSNLQLENYLLQSEKRIQEHVQASEDRTHQMVKEYIKELFNNIN